MSFREQILRSIILKIVSRPIDRSVFRDFTIDEHRMFDSVMDDAIPRRIDLQRAAYEAERMTT